MFYKLKNILSTKSLMSIYYGLFHSISTYAIIAWGNAYKNVIQKLLKLQERIINIILSKCKNQNLWKPITIKQTYYLNSVLKYYKFMRDRYVNNKSITRNKSQYHKIELEFGKKNYKYTAFKIFNKLPINLKSLKCNYKLIKKEIKKWIVTNIKQESKLKNIILTVKYTEL